MTPYGVATFISYRDKDDVYRLKLAFGMLYVKGEHILPDEEDCIDYDHAKSENSNNDRKAMEINEAYESLERMRQANLLLACQELGLTEIDYDACTVCLMEEAKKSKPSTSPLRKRWTTKRTKCEPCLISGCPCCPAHSSEVFRAEGITLSKECETVFHADFILSCMTLDARERRERIHFLVDLYDRTLLLLHYSKQYIPELVIALEEIRIRQSKINVGGSSAGIVSGVLGVAAAFTILTPAGPPLLVAALLFGGGSTALQTGTELKKQYFFEPGKVADRILALYGMLTSIITVTGTLREAMLLDQDLSRFVDDHSPAVVELRKEYVENREDLLAEATDSQVKSSLRLNRAMLAAAVSTERDNNRRRKRGTLDPKAKSSMSIVARNSRYMSRIGAGIMRTAQFAQFAGGALAAASLLIEARGMSNAIRSIRSGSCDKAVALQRIEQCMPNFPPTLQIEKECSAFLAFMNERNKLSEEEASQLLIEVSTKYNDSSESAESNKSESESNYDENELQPMIEVKEVGKSMMQGMCSTPNTSTSSSLDHDERENVPVEVPRHSSSPLVPLLEPSNVEKESFIIQ